jgi:hypothetical protein
METNHNLSRGLSPSAGSYISLGNSGMPARVTERRESPLPRRAVASAASGTSHVEAPKPGHEDVPRVAPGGAAGNQKPARDNACHNYGKLGHWAKECRQPRRGQAHVAQVEEVPALLLVHTSIELSPATSAAAALLHLDEPRAHALLGDGSSSDKTDGWCLDTGVTHHMTGRWEFFTELDSDVRGSVKFGDTSGMEIKGVGSVIFATESSERRLLTGVYYIPTLRTLSSAWDSWMRAVHVWRSRMES